MTNLCWGTQHRRQRRWSGTLPAGCERRKETGLDAAEMAYGGHLFQGYGYATQGYHVFRATGLRRDTAAVQEPEEQDLVTQAVLMAEGELMICDGSIKDATTVAALGLLRLKGLL